MIEMPDRIPAYLQELDRFIAEQLKPLEQADDNIRFFDHHRENARTDWERDGLPSHEWESLLAQARALAREAGHLFGFIGKPGQ